MLVSTTLAGPGAEASIVDALRSCTALVDHHLIALSGAAAFPLQEAIDRCPELARKVIYRTYPWPDDYGAARTEMLRWAESFGATWAITVDCDERLDIPATNPGEPLDGFDALCVGDAELLYQKPRFLRCGVGLRWEWPCAERLVGPDGKPPAMIRIPGSFRELPKDAGAELRRAERGVAHMPKVLRQGQNAHARRHLAECLLILGRETEAEEHFWQVAYGPVDSPLFERTWCKYRLAELYCTRNEYEDARELAGKALAEDPGLIQELGWILAHCAAQLKDFSAAALWCSYVLMAPMDLSRGGHRSPDALRQTKKLLEAIETAASRRMAERFTPEVFAERSEEFQADYDLLARALCETLSFGGCLDLGAGNGLLVNAMFSAGAFARGVEANPSAAEAAVGYAPGNTDFGVPLERWATWSAVRPQDLVTCIEVGEHLPPERADELVEACISNSSRWIVFSAAHPGQTGVGHVNEQPRAYWADKFTERGWTRARDHEAVILDRLEAAKRCWWLKRNLQVFRKL